MSLFCISRLALIFFIIIFIIIIIIIHHSFIINRYPLCFPLTTSVMIFFFVVVFGKGIGHQKSVLNIKYTICSLERASENFAARSFAGDVICCQLGSHGDRLLNIQTEHPCSIVYIFVSVLNATHTFCPNTE